MPVHVCAPSLGCEVGGRVKGREMGLRGAARAPPLWPTPTPAMAGALGLSDASANTLLPRSPEAGGTRRALHSRDHPHLTAGGRRLLQGPKRGHLAAWAWWSFGFLVPPKWETTEISDGGREGRWDRKKGGEKTGGGRLGFHYTAVWAGG